MYQVPVTNDAAQKFVTQLGDSKFEFDIQWNDRSGLFSLTLTNDDTKQIYFQGVPMVLGVDLLEPYNYAIGSLVLYDTTNRSIDANLDNLGDSVLLFWFTEQEKADAINATV